jgi:hypothetical protein
MFGMFCTSNVDIVALGHPCGMCNFNLLLLLHILAHVYVHKKISMFHPICLITDQNITCNFLQALKHLSLFFYTNMVALQLIECPHLQAAFKVFGVDLPGRKKLSTSMLDKAYEAAVLSTMPQCPCYHTTPSAVMGGRGRLQTRARLSSTS